MDTENNEQEASEDTSDQEKSKPAKPLSSFLVERDSDYLKHNKDNQRR